MFNFRKKKYFLFLSVEYDKKLHSNWKHFRLTSKINLIFNPHKQYFSFSHALFITVYFPLKVTKDDTVISQSFLAIYCSHN